MMSQTFVKSYMPDGKQIDKKTIINQAEELKGYDVDDWTRRPFGYKSFFVGDGYHLVKDRNDVGISFELNEPMRSRMASPARQFRGYSPRVPIATEDWPLLNQSRFENIDKDPNVLTRTKKPRNISFSKT